MHEVLLVALNAQYIHTSLSVRTLQAFAAQRGLQTEVCEYTINQPAGLILRELYAKQPRALLFSCYIWNIELVGELVRAYKKIAPDTPILLGGPQVSYQSEEVLARLPADGVLRGEGEEALCALLPLLEEPARWHTVPSLTWRDASGLHHTAPAPAPDLAALPFPYADLTALQGRILYYESSRGCPFSCSYCLSSSSSGVRLRPLERVFEDLRRFLQNRVRQVKFVDRTFNCNAAHAEAIWRFLIESDNGCTNFHFEISADLLTPVQLSLLSRARPGLFQFEVGVQSTNPPTLQAIRRTADQQKLFSAVRAVSALQNIHQHLDLIAGLPLEDLAAFSRSFDEVFALHPEQLQLGFLKVLPGSAMFEQTGRYGIRCSDTAPFEVLCTDALPFGDLMIIKEAEEMLELYYNSGRYRWLLRRLLEREPSPFGWFCALGRYYTAHGYHLASHSRVEYADILRGFCLEHGGFGPREEALARLDWCLHEKPRKRPEWMHPEPDREERRAISAFYRSEEAIARFLPQYAGQDSHLIERVTHLERFGFAVTTPGCPAQPCALLFDYTRRDLSGNAACIPVPLP